MLYGTLGPIKPVLRSLPHLHGSPHTVLDLLRVLSGVFLGVVAHQDGLAKGYTVRDSLHSGLGTVGVIGTLIAVVLEPLGSLCGAVNQARVFVADLAAQLNKQVLAGGRPSWGHE